MPLSGRDFLSLRDFTAEELYMFLNKAIELKRELKLGKPHELLKGKTLAMIFDFPSTRTRTSFETGMQQLGGHAIFFSPQHYWTKEKEAIKDTARVLSRYVHGIMIRAYNHEKLIEFAKWADVPIYNAATNYEHPCQVMADFMVTLEKKKRLEGVKYAVVWAYCKFNKPLGIVNSVLHAGSKLGMDITIACPEGYDPDQHVIQYGMKKAKLSGSKVTITRDMKEAVNGADVIHIKGWAPHEVFIKGIEAKAPHTERPQMYKKWIVTREVVDLAKKDVIIQHALPVSRGEEATDEVLEGPNSVIFNEAENRLHVQKAIMALTMR